MLKNLCFEKKVLIRKSMFHRTAKELREFDKENDIKLLELLEYVRRRNDKKIRGRKWDKVKSGLN